jgi:hypothetical protein
MEGLHEDLVNAYDKRGDARLFIDGTAGRGPINIHRDLLVGSARGGVEEHSLDMRLDRVNLGKCDSTNHMGTFGRREPQGLNEDVASVRRETLTIAHFDCLAVAHHLQNLIRV